MNVTSNARVQAMVQDCGRREKQVSRFRVFGCACYVRRLAALAFPVLLSLFAFLPLAAGQSGVKRRAELPSASEIIEKALERAKWAEEQKIEERLICRHYSLEEKLDAEKEVKSQEELLYKVYPLDGHTYYERVEVNGEPLSEEELRDRRENFRKEIAEQQSEKKEKEDDTDIKFNRELISRYRAKVTGRDLVNGRPAYVLSFEPKSKNLPVRRRIDHALNKSKGKLWIDAEDFGVVRVEFDLMKPVKFWGGILGKVGALSGRLEQTRLAEGIWFPKSISLYMKGRVLFSSFHQRRTMEWSNIELALPSVASQ